jgi:hypothetical protein
LAACTIRLIGSRQTSDQIFRQDTWVFAATFPEQQPPSPEDTPVALTIRWTARISDSEIGRAPSWMKYADLRARSATSTYCPGPSVHTAADHPTTPASGRAGSMTQGGERQ